MDISMSMAIKPNMYSASDLTPLITTLAFIGRCSFLVERNFPRIRAKIWNPQRRHWKRSCPIPSLSCANSWRRFAGSGTCYSERRMPTGIGSGALFSFLGRPPKPECRTMELGPRWNASLPVVVGGIRWGGETEVESGWLEHFQKRCDEGVFASEKRWLVATQPRIHRDVALTRSRDSLRYARVRNAPRAIQD